MAIFGKCNNRDGRTRQRQAIDVGRTRIVLCGDEKIYRPVFTFNTRCKSDSRMRRRMEGRWLTEGRGRSPNADKSSLGAEQEGTDG